MLTQQTTTIPPDVPSRMTIGVRQCLYTQYHVTLSNCGWVQSNGGEGGTEAVPVRAVLVDIFATESSAEGCGGLRHNRPPPHPGCLIGTPVIIRRGKFGSVPRQMRVLWTSFADYAIPVIESVGT